MLTLALVVPEVGKLRCQGFYVELIRVPDSYCEKAYSAGFGGCHSGCDCQASLSVNSKLRARASLIKTRPIASLTRTSPIITTMSTPPPSHTHLPPSLPTSPLTKRPKTEQSASMASSTEPAVSNGNAKPERAQSRAAPPPPLSSSPPLLVKKLSEKAKTPTRGSAFAAGYDLYSAMAGVIPARGRGLVDTDLAIAVGEGCCESSHHIHQSHAHQLVLALDEQYL